MTRGEWRAAEVASARLDDAVAARYRAELRVDWWAVAATERAYQLRLWRCRRTPGRDVSWMVPMIRELSERAAEVARGGR